MYSAHFTPFEHVNHWIYYQLSRRYTSLHPFHCLRFQFTDTVCNGNSVSFPEGYFTTSQRLERKRSSTSRPNYVPAFTSETIGAADSANTVWELAGHHNGVVREHCQEEYWTKEKTQLWRFSSLESRYWYPGNKDDKGSQMSVKTWGIVRGVNRERKKKHERSIIADAVFFLLFF